MHTEQQAAPRLGRYEIDPGGSAITFATRHMFGLLPVRGTFALRAGTVDLAEPLQDSSVRVEIETASIDTGNEQRDRDVRSARFLDAAHHPVMTYVSERVDETSVAGTLTVHGVSRPVTLTLEPPVVSARAFTIRATARIDRTEFGVTAARGMAGRYLNVTMDIRCVMAR